MFSGNKSHKTRAETVKTIEEAEQTDLENQRLALAKLDDISIVI